VVKFANRRLRLGVGVTGSIPVWLFFLGLAVLVVIRFVSLDLGNKIPENRNSKSRKGGRMDKVHAWSSTALETAWAVGGSMLAGLPLLT
jgi:hypothetical protein